MLKINAAKILFLLVLFNSCSTVKAPLGSVPDRKDLLTDAYGSWAIIETGLIQTNVEGELIAVHSDSIYILSKAQIRILPKTDIINIRIILFNKHVGEYSAWTIFLCLASISNGWFGIITGPINLIAGIVTISGEANRINYFDYPGHGISWIDLSKFSRFPQGLTDDIDTSILKPRPGIKSASNGIVN